jgi:heat shock protein HtpX
MNSQIYKNQTNNVIKTWLYLIVISLLVGLAGFLLASAFNNPIFLYTGVFLSIGVSIWSYWNSGSMVLKMANARPLGAEENPSLVSLVNKLSIQAGLPVPKIFIIDDPAPNAFATGRNPENGVVAFTTGILSLLNQDELAGVIAHELSHIANRDTLIMTVVAVFANIIQGITHYAFFFSGDRNREASGIIATVVFVFLAPLAATMIQLAISRKREFVADASGAILTQYPQGLANALVKIENFPQGMQNVNTSIAHLFIADPEKNEKGREMPWYVKLFMTHPPVAERVEALVGRK